MTKLSTLFTAITKYEYKLRTLYQEEYHGTKLSFSGTKLGLEIAATFAHCSVAFQWG